MGVSPVLTSTQNQPPASHGGGGLYQAKVTHCISQLKTQSQYLEHSLSITSSQAACGESNCSHIAAAVKELDASAVIKCSAALDTNHSS